MKLLLLFHMRNRLRSWRCLYASIRKRLKPLGVSFAAPAYAGDNACGVALLGLAAYQQEALHG